MCPGPVTTTLYRQLAITLRSPPIILPTYSSIILSYPPVQPYLAISAHTQPYTDIRPYMRLQAHLIITISAYPISLYDGIRVHLYDHWIVATKCISKITWSEPTRESANSLSHNLQICFKFSPISLCRYLATWAWGCSPSRSTIGVCILRLSLIIDALLCCSRSFCHCKTQMPNEDKYERQNCFWLWNLEP